MAGLSREIVSSSTRSMKRPLEVTLPCQEIQYLDISYQKVGIHAVSLFFLEVKWKWNQYTNSFFRFSSVQFRGRKLLTIPFLTTPFITVTCPSWAAKDPWKENHLRRFRFPSFVHSFVAQMDLFFYASQSTTSGIFDQRASTDLSGTTFRRWPDQCLNEERLVAKELLRTTWHY